MNEKGEQFKSELQQLCQKYNVGIYAGMFGIKFNFMNPEDKANNEEYYNQHHDTKEFIAQEDGDEF
jgi:hypothetical protein